MTISRETLIERLRLELERRSEILEAYLFGSFARGDAKAHSDVDVAVYLDPARRTRSGLGDAVEISSVLMSVLERNDVDVVILNDGTPLLYHRVLRDGIRLFARDLPATTAREGYALSRYLDDQHRIDMIDAILSERWKRGELGR